MRGPPLRRCSGSWRTTLTRTPPPTTMPVATSLAASCKQHLSLSKIPRTMTNTLLVLSFKPRCFERINFFFLFLRNPCHRYDGPRPFLLNFFWPDDHISLQSSKDVSALFGQILGQKGRKKEKEEEVLRAAAVLNQPVLFARHTLHTFFPPNAR